MPGPSVHLLLLQNASLVHKFLHSHSLAKGFSEARKDPLLKAKVSQPPLYSVPTLPLGHYPGLSWATKHPFWS